MDHDGFGSASHIGKHEEDLEMGDKRDKLLKPLNRVSSASIPCHKLGITRLIFIMLPRRGLRQSHIIISPSSSISTDASWLIERMSQAEDAVRRSREPALQTLSQRWIGVHV
jgi:hypothetical protein